MKCTVKISQNVLRSYIHTHKCGTHTYGTQTYTHTHTHTNTYNE